MNPAFEKRAGPVFDEPDDGANPLRARIIRVVRRLILHLLGSIAFLHACFWLSAGWAAAQGASCDSMAQHPLNLRAFHKAVDTFGNLLVRQPAAASALLVCLHRDNRALAETLMLHQRRLRTPVRNDTVVEDAFLHYVVNASEPKLSDQESADLARLARRYRQALLLAAEPEAQAVATCDPLPWTLSRLRCFGQRANRERYGRDDVVPVELLEFDTATDAYSVRNATWMAEMSALAYWGADLSGQQLQRWGFARISEITDPATDTNGFIAIKDKVLVLSFRGTSGFRDFLTDGDIRRVRTDWTAGTVHNGFKSALDAVWPQITAKLGPTGSQQQEIWLTGHSLGAALAQLAAMRLTSAGYRVRNVYTFGTPRIGDRDFVAEYDRRLGSRSFPHVNSQDVVTRVPPSPLGFHVTASARIRQFTGPGHEMKQLTGESTDGTDASDDWRSLVRRSIERTTAFLPSALRPTALRSARPAIPAAANLYSATFARGPLDDHGSFEYLFKLVCAAIEYDLWPIENRQSSANPPDSPRR